MECARCPSNILDFIDSAQYLECLYEYILALAHILNMPSFQYLDSASTAGLLGSDRIVVYVEAWSCDTKASEVESPTVFSFS